MWMGTGDMRTGNVFVLQFEFVDQLFGFEKL